jgi:signal transduction histidine kinase
MRDRIEKLGGRFDLESTAGRGTTLRFDTPLNEAL